MYCISSYKHTLQYTCIYTYIYLYIHVFIHTFIQCKFMQAQLTKYTEAMNIDIFKQCLT